MSRREQLVASERCEYYLPTEWLPVFVLPNVQLTTATGCDLAALAPAHDPRVAALKRAHPHFRRVLRGFSDNFGEKFEPAALLVSADAPDAVGHVGAVASFRDLIAISTICMSRAQELVKRRGLRIIFGESFAFYPWMIDRHFEDVI